MKIIDKFIKCQSRSEIYEIIPIGDTHIGTRNCAETPLKNLVREIGNNNRAYVIFGGDLHDAITPQDIGRFDFESLPDWMVEGDALNTREKLNDIITQQADRVYDIFSPIPRERIIGAISGNHEFSILKYSGRALHKSFCKKMNIADLDDEALIRLRFKRANHVTTIIIYIRHGYGGGRTPGAEPNKLSRMLDEWEIADICFTGHTHTFDILPPKPVLEIPKSGSLPKECLCRYRWAANWGCWVYSHQRGTSYASRVCYPARPMLTCKAVIKPFAQKRIKGKEAPVSLPHIEIRSVTI